MVHARPSAGIDEKSLRLTAAVTLIPGVVFAAGLDGMARAFSTVDGKELWAYDTTQEVKTVNGITTRVGLSDLRA